MLTAAAAASSPSDRRGVTHHGPGGPPPACQPGRANHPGPGNGASEPPLPVIRWSRISKGGRPGSTTPPGAGSRRGRGAGIGVGAPPGQLHLASLPRRHVRLQQRVIRTHDAEQVLAMRQSRPGAPPGGPDVGYDDQKSQGEGYFHLPANQKRWPVRTRTGVRGRVAMYMYGQEFCRVAAMR
jgi:hypothetical protein